MRHREKSGSSRSAAPMAKDGLHCNPWSRRAPSHAWRNLGGAELASPAIEQNGKCSDASGLFGSAYRQRRR